MKRALAFLALAVPLQAGPGGIVPWVERVKPRPDLLKRVDIEQRLDAQIPLDLVFRDEHGQPVKLGALFGKRPVALALVYYECPMLCTLALNGQLRAFRMVRFDLGKDYDAIEVSINPRETPVLAAAKKATYLNKYRRAGAERGWHFLTGTEENIRALADAVGFHYAWDPVSQQYAHATALVTLTPEGRIARYQYGVEYSPRDLQFSIMDASRGKIGTAVEHVLMYCFHYDPATGKYSLLVTRLVQGGAAATVLLLFGFIGFASLRYRARPLGRRG
jgi:protein SCO1/2